MKIYDEKKKAYRVSASFEDFEGDIEKWRYLFYEVHRLQLTWKIAYEIGLIERRGNDDKSWWVNLDILVKPAFKDKLLEWMDDNGYRNVRTAEENIGIVYAYEHDELEGIWHLYLDE